MTLLSSFPSANWTAVLPATTRCQQCSILVFTSQINLNKTELVCPSDTIEAQINILIKVQSPSLAEPSDQISCDLVLPGLSSSSPTNQYKLMEFSWCQILDTYISEQCLSQFQFQRQQLVSSVCDNVNLRMRVIWWISFLKSDRIWDWGCRQTHTR